MIWFGLSSNSLTGWESKMLKLKKAIIDKKITRFNMNSFLFLVCVVPMVFAGMLGEDNMGSWEKKEGGMMSEYEKWQMKDKKDQMMYLHKFQEFLLFKDKLQKMKEMEHKKNVFEEFMKWKMNKMGEKKSEEQDDGMKKEESGDFGVVLKKMASDAHKNAMMITHAFLALCKCQNEMGIEKMFDNKDDKGSKDSTMGDMFEGDMPDFMGNMTAKAEFLKNLSKVEQKKMFGYGLVKSMCNGAKTFIVHAKEFEETYMKN
ncbi:hypothetical protein LOTGIDRAFT_231066 [Lottia gigantea]|uniref:Uncharacterized protein n=1 Tax=Lottia gigantea TaxID=225164 RepID=V4CC18_LOTGI|nr:hypothetical protein LOTGIDRAFT_231066 [Lottia gigantea]ESO99404.1 hypothetical protein LOTGIDRAFT_231066 [Lottia gigantea]